MKRTSTISLGGMNFTIDDDAYDVLNQYFLALSKRFPEDEKEEILRDIESRMAELFTFKLQTRNVIDINDVNEVIFLQQFKQLQQNDLNVVVINPQCNRYQ